MKKYWRKFKMGEKKKIVLRKVFLFVLFLIILTAETKAAVISSDDFESGTLNGWTTTGGTGNWHANNTGPIDPPINNWHMISSNVPNPVYAEKSINTNGYQNIIFSFYYKPDTNDLDCADGDFLRGEWYDGSTWNIILDICGNVPTSYTLSTNNLNSAANNNPNFKVRFGCNGGPVTSGTEGCAIDNVDVSGTIIPDNTPPIITLNSPQNNQFINTNSVTFNITLNENGSAWYTLNNGINNISMSSVNNKDFNHTNTSIANGQYIVKFYANDTNNNMNNTVQSTFTIDTTKPLLLITTPQNTSYNLIQTQLNYSVSDTNLQVCWYSLNNGITNASINCGQNITGLSSPQGSSIWRVWANDSAGNINSSSVTFFIDSVFPLISFGTGTENNNSIKSQNFIFINVSVTETNEANITFSLYNTTSTINITTFTTQQRTINFSNLGDEVYFYNATIKDVLNNINATETRTITLDNIPPSLSIIAPQNVSYNNATLLVNISSNGVNTWFFNGTSNETYISPSYRTFPEGTTAIIAYANDSAGNLNYSSLTFFIDSISPLINIIHPEQKTYGTNATLPLNFSIIDLGTSVNSCWYNLNNGANISLPNCQNTTFNVTGDGNHMLNLFANDSLGNIGNSSVLFSVITTAPAINLIYPINNSYLNYKNMIYLNYSVVSGIGISSCELWGNFGSMWHLNQTNSSISSENNFFVLDLTDRDYNWGIICSDTQNRKNNINRTFHIDTLFPTISLAEPIGTKTSRNNIPFVFSTSDTNLQSCWYNVYRGINLEIENTSISCNATGYFNVTVDSTFSLNFYANDSAGNINYSSISFTVSSSTPSPPSGEGSSTGGGGGGGGFPSKRNLTAPPKISFSEPKSLVIKRGTSTTAEIEITNEERIFLNDCKLILSGSQASWFSNSQSQGLSPGEKFKFSLSIKIPEETEPGDYSQRLTVECDEGKQSINFYLTVFRNNFETKITNYKRTVDTLRIFYSIREFAQKNHDIILKYNLLNLDEIIVVDGQESISLKPGEEKSALLEFKIPKDISGEFALKMLLDDAETSNDVAQQILLQSKSILGLAISDSNKKTLSLFGIIFLSSIALFFISRFIYKSYKQHKINAFIEGIEEKHGKKLIKLNVHPSHK